MTATLALTWAYGYQQHTIVTRLDRRLVSALVHEVWSERPGTGKTPVLEVPEGFRLRILGRLTFTLLVDEGPDGVVIRSRVDYALSRRPHLSWIVPHGTPRLDGGPAYEAFCRALADRIRRTDTDVLVVIEELDGPDADGDGSG